MNYAIIDLDGTCSNCDHRLIHIVDANGDKLKNQNWKQFFENCEDDLVFEDMQNIVKSLYSSGVRIFFVTGRPNKMVDGTVQWIKKYFDDILFQLYMRDFDDHRPDYEVKTDLVINIMEKNKWSQPVIAYEDRDSVIKYWRKRFDFPIIDVKEMRNVRQT